MRRLLNVFITTFAVVLGIQFFVLLVYISASYLGPLLKAHPYTTAGIISFGLSFVIASLTALSERGNE